MDVQGSLSVTVSGTGTRLAVNRAVGKALEEFLVKLIEREFGQEGVNVLTQKALTGPGGKRIFDLLVSIGNRIVVIELKSNLPMGGSAFARLIGQLKTFSNAEQAFAQGAEVITFAAEAPEAALLRVEAQLAKDGVSTLGFVQTIPELMQALRGVFCGI